ncbi:MAG TPA: Lrp/AsnC family transcriptional regulator [Pyrodictium sp.]|nr:Lrp/AsnC family transcriptional regulator [Pyrodictium sp.]
MSSQLDRLDREIVRLLAEDARLSIRSLAARLGVAPSTLHARLQRLVANGVIKRFTIIPDYDQLGYTITALTLLAVEGKYIESIARELTSYPNVVAVYDITGDYDLAIISKFKNIDGLNKFLKTVNRNPHIRRTVTSVVLKVFKEDIVAPILSERVESV